MTESERQYLDRIQLQARNAFLNDFNLFFSQIFENVKVLAVIAEEIVSKASQTQRIAKKMAQLSLFAIRNIKCKGCSDPIQIGVLQHQMQSAVLSACLNVLQRSIRMTLTGPAHLMNVDDWIAWQDRNQKAYAVALFVGELYMNDSIGDLDIVNTLDEIFAQMEHNSTKSVLSECEIGIITEIFEASGLKMESRLSGSGELNKWFNHLAEFESEKLSKNNRHILRRLIDLRLKHWQRDVTVTEINEMSRSHCKKAEKQCCMHCNCPKQKRHATRFNCPICRIDYEKFYKPRPMNKLAQIFWYLASVMS